MPTQVKLEQGEKIVTKYRFLGFFIPRNWVSVRRLNRWIREYHVVEKALHN